MVIVTKKEDAVSNHSVNQDAVAPCSHKEADTNIFVHAKHATETGSKVIMIKASDTDVVVIAVSVLPPPAVDCLWTRTEPEVASCA